MTREDEYQRNAAECQRMAAYTRNEDDRRRWLKMADSWTQMIRGQSRRDSSSDAIDAAQSEKRIGQKDSN